MRSRFAYFTLTLSILVVGSLWSPRAKRFLTPILVAWWPRAIPFSRLQDFEHLFAYSAVAVVAISIWHTARQAAWALLGLTGIAIALESCQHWIYHIPIEWSDVRDDLAGLASGYVLAMLFKRFVPRYPKQVRRRY